MSEVEEIKSRIDVVDLVGQYVTLKKAGASYKGICPFHQEKTPSFMVNPERQIWKCFGCSKSGDIFSFVMERESLEFPDALRMLASRAGVTLKPRTAAEHQSQDNKAHLYQINRLSSGVFHKILTEKTIGQPALAYLKQRKITRETIDKFQIGFAPSNFKLAPLLMEKGFSAGEITRAGSPEKFFNRIIFPIFDVLGNVIAFTGRAMGEVQPKYLNSPETPLFNKGRTIYGLNFAKGAIKEKDRVILVEGQMDVVALHQSGICNAVASSGTALTEQQLQFLAKYTSNFILAFDADEAGQQTTRKVVEMLLRFDQSCKVVSYGRYKDAGEMLAAEPKSWSAAEKAAVEGFDWVIEKAKEQSGKIQFIENKKKLIRAVLPLLGVVEEPTRRDHYIRRLAMAIESKPETIYAALKKMAQPISVGQIPPAETISSEDQLLGIILAFPRVLEGSKQKLSNLSWQSEDSSQIARQVDKCYAEPNLADNSAQFVERIKSGLTQSQINIITSSQVWLTREWPELTFDQAKEIFQEQWRRFTRLGYEQEKDQLANAIRRAQEANDIAEVKRLMEQLNKMAKRAPGAEPSAPSATPKE